MHETPVQQYRDALDSLVGLLRNDSDGKRFLSRNWGDLIAVVVDLPDIPPSDWKLHQIKERKMLTERLKAQTVADFKKGDVVRYIPMHAYGNADHADCENGIVSSTNDTWVFVKYSSRHYTVNGPDDPKTSAATSPTDLMKFEG